VCFAEVNMNEYWQDYEHTMPWIRRRAEYRRSFGRYCELFRKLAWRLEYEPTLPVLTLPERRVPVELFRTPPVPGRTGFPGWTLRVAGVDLQCRTNYHACVTLHRLDWEGDSIDAILAHCAKRLRGGVA
jgi:hypothetical protein